MIFDQYSRYSACASLLKHYGYRDGKAVLDVGSGAACLLKELICRKDVVCIDPLLPDLGNAPCSSGDIFDPQMDCLQFPFVTAVDVLEHIVPDSRKLFLTRLSAIASEAIILGFPAFDNPEATKTDQLLNDHFQSVFGKSYPWLQEHFDYGLPRVSETCKILTELGWNCQTVEHGKCQWLNKLLAPVLCLWEIPYLRPLVQNASLMFNQFLASFDYGACCYRSFIIASREKLSTIEFPVASKEKDQLVDQIASELQSAFFTYGLNSLQAVEGFIESISQNSFFPSLEYQLSTGNGTQPEDLISGFRKSLNMLTNEFVSIRQDNSDCQVKLLEKQAQLMEMSDWADAMQTEKSRMQVSIDAMQTEKARMQVSIDAMQIEKARMQANIDAMQAETIRMQSNIADQRKKHKELTGDLIQLQTSFSEKQRQLMEMSDWADGMRKELDKRNAQLPHRLRMLNRRIRNAVQRRSKRFSKDFWFSRLKRLIARKQLPVPVNAIKNSMSYSRRRLILVFSVIEWDFRWQRPQQMITRLRDNGYTILYVSVSVSPLKRSVEDCSYAGEEVRISQLDHHIYRICLHSVKSLNIYSDLISGKDLQNMVLEAEYILKKLQPTSITYLVHFPGWWPVVEQLRTSMSGTLLYDCMDDHSGFNTSREGLVDIENALIKNADKVITSSVGIDARCRRLNLNTTQIKNGTEFHHFFNAKRNGKLDHLMTKPVIGYYGAISEWFDMDIIAYCARKRKSWHFVLIGSTFGADLLPLQGVKNVYLLGEQPYKDLPGYLAYFSVCTIPFKIIPLTTATNPVKFYEYMSAGKPVVSTKLPELSIYSELCRLSKTPEDFLAALDAAIIEKQTDKLVMQRQAFARENSWDKRVQDFLAIMK
jgi:glycosyltransferase involved in cell wall biosynthesis